MAVLHSNQTLFSFYESIEKGEQFKFQVFPGEWLYVSLSESDIVLSQLTNFDKENIATNALINIVQKPHSYPDFVTVSEEVKISLFHKNRTNLYDRCMDILRLYDIEGIMQCNHLSYEAKLLLDIIISTETLPSILYLDNVVDSLPVNIKFKISDYLHSKTSAEGLTVIIASDSEEFKNTYLGREIHITL